MTMARWLPMAPMMVPIVAPRSEVEVEAGAIIVLVVPMPRTMPVPAMPVAPVPHFDDVRVLARYLAEVSRCATYRCGLSRCEEHQHEDGHS